MQIILLATTYICTQDSQKVDLFGDIRLIRTCRCLIDIRQTCLDTLKQNVQTYVWFTQGRSVWSLKINAYRCMHD